MRILKRVQDIPGGLMMLPLLFAAAINTFIPQVLNIGSFTTALFSGEGTKTVVALSLMFLGSSFKLKEAPEGLKRGIVLLAGKVLSGAFIGLLINKFFGYEGIFGISILAIVSAATNSNNGLYMTLVNQYGEEKDFEAQSILNFNTGPLFALIVFGASGSANINPMDIVSTIGPLLIGILLGNLDEDIRSFLKPGITIIIPFMGFCLGSSINLSNILQAGLSGIALGFIVLIFTGIPLVAVDKLINKRPGYAGAAISSTAGNAVATPAAVAFIDPKFTPFVTLATTQVAAAVIVTIVLTPIFTVYIAKKFGYVKIEV